MATGQQPQKRQLEVDQEAFNSPTKRAKATEPAIAANAPQQQKAGLCVPSLSEPINAGALVPALQQLLAVYKVEYWAALEELRTRHQAFCGSGRQTVAVSEAAGNGNVSKAVADGHQGSIRQLVQATLPQQHHHDSLPAAQQPPEQQEHSAYGDDCCGYGSPQEQLPAPKAVEQLLLQLQSGPGEGAATAEQLQHWHERFKAASATISGLEQLASAASLQLMDCQGALACLCGSTGRWMIRRTAVSIGRSSDTKGDVDVDLSKAVVTAVPSTAAAGLGSTTPRAAAAAAAVGGTLSSVGAGGGSLGDAKKVSRLQAQLSLELDGTWMLRNTGRAGLVVNGHKVPRGAKVSVPHLSLLEVGGDALLFMVNGLAVQRAVARSSHLVM